MVFNIPDKCKLIFDKLNNSGFECFAVGGCVRDTLMGKTPDDWDFTTNATPDEISACFKEYKLIDIGKDFGTICVVIDHEPFEITTYRCDGRYNDSRHPESVTFSSTIEDDLSRRDFTMNSIAYSPFKGIVDLFGGVDDIKARIIRTTGDSDKRFNEDALRMFRALRFSSKLGFDIEDNTAQAIDRNKHLIKAVHPQRLRKELCGLLLGDNVCSVLSRYRVFLAQFIPELAPMFDFKQNNPHHIYDVWQHTVSAVGLSKPVETIRLALLFHDCGKPHTHTTDERGIDHFKMHQFKSEKIARDVLTRFAYSGKAIDDVCTLIRFHDERFRNLSVDIKRVLSKVSEEQFEMLLEVSRCDMLAQSLYKREEKILHHNEVKKEVARIIESGECYSLSQLAINGNDILSSGFKGKQVGQVLEICLKGVIKGKVSNEKEALLSYIRSVQKL